MRGGAPGPVICRAKGHTDGQFQQRGGVLFLAGRTEITLYCAETRLWQVKGKEGETSWGKLQEEVGGDVRAGLSQVLMGSCQGGAVRW